MSPRRNPRFYVTSPAEDQLVLLDETAALLFEHHSCGHLFTQIDGTQSAVDILATLHDIGQQFTLLSTIDHLVAEGFLEAYPTAQLNAHYHRPDFLAAPAMPRHHDRDVNPIILS